MDNKSYWDNLRNYIAKKKFLSILFFVLIMIIGMITASVVNYISTDPLFSKALYVGGIFGLVTLALGIWLFAPFFSFRFKYNFLNDYDEELAKYIYTLKKRSNSLLKSTDGIIAIQLFQIEKETLTTTISYNFKDVFEKKHKKSKVSKMNPNKLIVPIEFISWLYKYEYTKDITDVKKFKLNVRLQQLLFDYLRDKFHKEYIRINDEQTFEDIDKLFADSIGSWEMNFPKRTLYKSVHYLILFRQVDPYKIYLGDLDKIEPTHIELLTPSILPPGIKPTSNNIYSHEYNNKNKRKQHRIYFNLYFEINSLEEGKQQYVLLIIADKRFIPDTFAASNIFENMLQ